MFTNQNKYQNNKYFMSLALQQASKNLGNTKMNPSVGCVITKSENVIAAGCTGYNGTPHAETNAISCLKENLKNVILYVTLEPCSHYGKTPPCTNLIIKKKIRKVFFSIKDPDNRSHNKSHKKLSDKKIYVKNGILKNEVKNFYKSYIKFKKKNIPFVTCKLAVSKDFYTHKTKGDKWITNKFSRGRVHLMRSFHDSIVTSSNTVIIDNPELTCRINGLRMNSPTRIILDKELRIPLNSKVIINAKKYNTIIFHNNIKTKKMKLLKNLKVKLFKLNLDNENNLDLTNMLIKIGGLGYSRIFLESGTKLIKSFLNRNLIDEFKLFISPKKLGKVGGFGFKKEIDFLLKKNNKIIEKVNLFGDRLISFNLK